MLGPPSGTLTRLETSQRHWKVDGRNVQHVYPPSARCPLCRRPRSSKGPPSVHAPPFPFIHCSSSPVHERRPHPAPDGSLATSSFRFRGRRRRARCADRRPPSLRFGPSLASLWQEGERRSVSYTGRDGPPHRQLETVSVRRGLLPLGRGGWDGGCCLGGGNAGGGDADGVDLIRVDCCITFTYMARDRARNEKRKKASWVASSPLQPLLPAVFSPPPCSINHPSNPFISAQHAASNSLFLPPRPLQAASQASTRRLARVLASRRDNPAGLAASSSGEAYARSRDGCETRSNLEGTRSLHRQLYGRPHLARDERNGSTLRPATDQY